jgi:hypothetical protein
VRRYAKALGCASADSGSLHWPDKNLPVVLGWIRRSESFVTRAVHSPAHQLQRGQPGSSSCP